MLEHFYHKTIRKVVVSFGTLFNDIYIARFDDSGNELERIKVPISYGPQQKFLRRLARIGTDFDANKVRIENYLPRMTFEIQNITYDPTRKLSTMNQTLLYKDATTSTKRYERVPYNIDMNLGIMAKNTEDALQIMEQILPYFQPEYTVTIKMNDMDPKVNVPFVFKSCTLGEGDDGSYGNATELRKLTYISMVFTAKLYLYGPFADQKIITDVATNFFANLNVGVGMTGSQVRVVAGAGITAGSFDPDLSGHTDITNTTY
jgi:T4-like virus Myoviridae tail sheath stabiliser